MACSTSKDPCFLQKYYFDRRHLADKFLRKSQGCHPRVKNGDSRKERNKNGDKENDATAGGNCPMEVLQHPRSTTLTAGILLTNSYGRVRDAIRVSRMETPGRSGTKMGTRRISTTLTAGILLTNSYGRVRDAIRVSRMATPGRSGTKMGTRRMMQLLVAIVPWKCCSTRVVGLGTSFGCSQIHTIWSQKTWILRS
ncbi:uncharacterized protein [Dermacentor andersoni]|uniref:uncharacterized protein isoform X3 n=1 Tax=Dermacentor andersoni TaxID=34620 RepID=UPI0024166D69|nr:uncharacterized protein LOC129386926 isoform X3 [Dermacentor andersoni]